MQYIIAYDLLSSYANFGRGYKVITVEMNPEPDRTNWVITEIITTHFPYEAVTPAEMIRK